ncbi:MAG: DNA glycosylase [Candidatus Omnitrophota bacterium]|nr:DNA glycosylase [Candidatus Omnitrophota bacterium]
MFRWADLGGGSFGGWIDGSFARVSQEGDRLLFRGVSGEAAHRFFSLETDLPAVTGEFDVDPAIHEALRRYPGLRVIRQDPWECAASFMLSAYNNIPRLTGMLDQLSCRFASPRGGDSLALPSRRLGLNPFPRPEVLAKVSERVLRNCGLGYRAPYLKAMAQAVASTRMDLERLRALEDEGLRRALLTLPGIGEKVVECVMLFAYGRGAAFPVDVWIGRAMRGWYFRRRKVSDKKIREFARKHFGPYCGWAQQYLYCLARQMPC